MSLVSVIIPVYNVERYIKKCLEAALGQTFENIEYILIDDCSTDRSRVYLKTPSWEKSETCFA